ncbi:hypothetical protein F441_17556 [Phytophthora nicotianae CJ01A1]|uniref:Transmembrane protein n=5 Tax=Phytophthora nicotianae TaxID=4792 RepID=V9EAL4_PHYNI|nr:hypothetical protein F443_17680 [Phytophthora nicotianae P1569]ETK76340.1 hypothetical protein L915_17219 [Phytophthora nicotianae]ETO64838.1 hypothetical protein F444_17721 [Phytophthora nicotianae P1976]ETP05945.1 hypothetical protein F441_17556 [Phytophthora nicotianae CJ01A1]ETP34058.1 hypothetical protein F442_17537 [Phytophthora nicotianae P10297]
MGPDGKVIPAINRHVKGSTPLQRKFRLFHRLVVFGAAVWYIVISLMATDAALDILKDQAHYDSGLIHFTSPLIAGYAGTSTIRKSPLVVDVLGDSTKPRNSGTLFLESESNSSFTQCSAVLAGHGVDIYTDEFLRWMFEVFQNKTAYNISLLDEVELVLPVVDCELSIIRGGSAAVARVNYLARYKNDTERVLLLPTSLSIQDYYITEQYERGAALLLSFAVVEDMATEDPIPHHFAIALDYPYEYKPDFEVCTFYEYTSEGFWSFETIPRDSFMRPPKPLLTARQLGFYLDKETSQVNQINFHWIPADDPATELANWTWRGDAVIRDNWAWVHIIHLFFAIDVMFQLSLLLFLVYRSILQKHFWIGDAFASISNALLYRGIYVIISNHVNGYWTLIEFCLALADHINGSSNVKYRPALVHADMLTIYLNIVSVLSYMVRERIDPIFVLVCFEIGFNSREAMTKLFPSLKQMLIDYSTTEATYGLVAVDDFLSKLSPMRLWTVHPIHQNVWPLITVTFVIIYSTILIILVYVFVRKLLRYRSPKSQTDINDISISRRQTSNLSLRDDADEPQLMQFETATGSVLKNRFGILSTYKNYTYVNGRRFASGDAIYCNGFVVANDKFIIATEDLMSLLIMKITRARFTNIYVYTIKEGRDVNQTARLVYPTTISWHDLAKVSVSPLS